MSRRFTDEELNAVYRTRDVVSDAILTNTASASIFQGLTAKKIRDNMTSIMADLRANDEGLLRPRRSAGIHAFGGVPIVTSPFLPDEQPAIQIRDIRLKDGTSLLSTAFLMRENLWWKEQYGTRPVAFMMGDTVAVHPKVQAMLMAASKAIDDELLKVMPGRQP